ncbi:MAG: DUF362 domain-containing protein [Deltaproteobacteria bacterium]
MKKSKVFLIHVDCSDTTDSVKQKVARLIDTSKVLMCVSRGDLTAVKMHFGEEGNTGYVKPEYAGVVCEHISQREALPFLSDANTLYTGRRGNARDHIQLAQDHGFTENVAHAVLDIPEESPKNTVDVPLNLKYIKNAKIASPFMRCQALVSISHFKGHLLCGFGGSIKNIGMGCATRQGKLAMHSDVAPIVATHKCNACLSCREVCPVKAVGLRGGKTYIDSKKCIGCGSCIGACRSFAIEIDWEAGGSRVQPKIAEYAKAVLQKKQGKLAFFNFATHITKECDCMAKDDPSVVSDVGILASSDPVAIDKASYDLVVEEAGKDIFEELHPGRNGLKQLEYSSELGLGNLEYELVEVS